MWLRRLRELLAKPIDQRSDPRTLKVESKTGVSERPAVFDPALLHFRKGMRGGEPQFAVKEDGRNFLKHRYQMLQLILDRIVDCDAAQHLVLRGSAVMRSWFPNQARHPGDLDWVVTPHTLPMDSPQGEQLVTDVITALRGAAVSEETRIRDEEFVIESIWTYDRAPGVRVLVPWSCPVEPLSTIQMDFVFEEELAYPLEQEEIGLCDSQTVTVTVAGREQSLAWKLMWLATDCHPMGKDLYDAVLLAESSTLTAEGLLRTVAPAASHYGFSPVLAFAPARFEGLAVEWDWFVTEYPNVPGTQEEWRDRLVTAIRDVLDEIQDPKR